MNFSDILKVRSAMAPHDIAIKDGVNHRTYLQMFENSCKFGQTLMNSGIQKGDKVAVLLNNCVEISEIFFGTVKVGGIIVPINTRLAAPEIEYILNNSDSKVIIFGNEFIEIVTEIMPRLIHTERFILLDSSSQFKQNETKIILYEDVLSKIDSVNTQDAYTTSDEDDCIILYTSGTTGKPKGVVRSHKGCLWAVANYLITLPTFHYDKELYAIPLASIGFVNIFAPKILSGVPVVIMKKFDPQKALQIIEEENITMAYFVPTMWNMLLHVNENETYNTESLRLGIWGGEFMPTSVYEKVIQRFGDILVGVWGATEGGLSAGTPDIMKGKIGCAGRATGINEFKVVDNQGNELPAGQVGELINRTPAMLKEYYKNPEASKSAIKDGWYYTGDLARIDEEGFIYIVDRKKEMIVSGGQNIYPAEIQQVLYEYPAILEAAVIGVPDDDWGEAVLAVIVLKETYLIGKDITNEDIVEYCKQNLASYKKPKYIAFVNELPKNPAGKVMKGELREMYQQGIFELFTN